MEAKSSRQREWVLAAVDRYEVPLTRYASRLLGELDAARDAVQHAFLQLCEQSPETLGERLAQWLFAVCRNKAMDSMRRRRRASPMNDGDGAALPSREPDPAVAAECHDLYARLNEAVAQLPANQREAIDLWVEGFAYRQIAKITRQSEGNVRVLVHRALRSLRLHPVASELIGATGGQPGACRAEA